MRFIDIITLVLQMSKLSHGEVKTLTQYHTKVAWSILDRPRKGLKPRLFQTMVSAICSGS